MEKRFEIIINLDSLPGGPNDYMLGRITGAFSAVTEEHLRGNTYAMYIDTTDNICILTYIATEDMIQKGIDIIKWMFPNISISICAE